MDVTCSHPDCGEQILGTVVFLAPPEGSSIDWQAGGYDDYVNQLPDGGYVHYVMLHPNCFQQVFNEFMRLELMTVLTLIIGPIGILKEEFAME